VGIDIYEDGIKKMQADGEEVYLANAESFDINIKDFDLVVLGDIIEHVSNPGLVLDNANRHLHDEGILFVTTPNPFSIAMFLKILVRGGYNVNSEHVTWFDPVLLSFLLDRSGFKSAQLLWTGPSKHSILRFLLSFRSDLRADFGIVGKKFRSIATKTNETRIEII
jgi:SAM-dependent methyltransferase